jgi:hypothetical protein
MPAKSTTAAGTASQLIPRVRPTTGRKTRPALASVIAAALLLWPLSLAHGQARSSEPPPTTDRGTGAESCIVPVERSDTSISDRVRYSFTVDNQSPHVCGRVLSLRVHTEGLARPLRVLSPKAWEAHLVVCEDGQLVCAVEWTAIGGLRPGFSQSGFILELPAGSELPWTSMVKLERGDTIVHLEPAS